MNDATDKTDNAASPEGVRHVPVMLDEVIKYLAPKKDEVFIDGTFGAGGYTSAILNKGASVIAIDRDPDAIANGTALVEQAKGRLSLLSGKFSRLDELANEAGFEQVDGVVLDVGVSSMQLNEQERGFSFLHDGPLDMRMAQKGPSAADLVNGLERANLTRIIGILGEERHASRVSKAILERREEMLFSRTSDLAKVVEKAVGKSKNDRIHPATRTFQALRIFVNNELEELALALLAAERIIKPGGRLVVVSFHSLEDRLVKRFLVNRSSDQVGSRHLPQVKNDPSTFALLKRGAVGPRAEEVEQNPRSRSAKLRAAVRSDAAFDKPDLSIFKMADFSGVVEISGRNAR